MKKILYFGFAVLLTTNSIAQTKVDRSKQPKPGPAPTITIKDPVTFNLPNGITVLVVENHKLPKVSATLSIDRGPILEGEKERTQYYEGVVISISNRGLGRSFTLRRSVQGVGVEQVFLLNSPKIVSIIKKQSSKVRRAKLYFIRSLRGKSARLKAKL
jgi:ribosomal protein L19